MSTRSEFGEPGTALGFLSDSGAVVATHYADPDPESPSERLTLELHPASSKTAPVTWLEQDLSDIFSEEAGHLRGLVDDLAGLFGRERVQRAVNEVLSQHS